METTSRGGESLKAAMLAGRVEQGVSANNPYFFPKWSLKSELQVNGVNVMVPWKKDPVAATQEIRTLPMREDDVVLMSFPKSGSHWVSEILTMLVTGSSDYAKGTKASYRIDGVDDLSSLSGLPSPRVLNAHLYHAHMPEEMVTKKVKIVHLIRNPKDTVVSMWNHGKQVAPPQYTFDNFLKGYTAEGYTFMSNQFNYLRQMAQFEQTHPNHPIKHVHYEDLKQAPVQIIRELAEFLGVPSNLALCEEIAQACSFDRLKVAEDARKRSQDASSILVVFRKGIIGDWKNQFTVAQNEMFDDFIREQMKKGLHFTFRGLTMPQ